MTSWKVLSRIMEEGVENDELGQGIEVGHSSCTVYMSGSFQLKRCIAPNDTIFNTPLRDSLLCSLMSIFLSMVPDCIAYIFFFRLSNSLSSNSLLKPLLVGLDAIELLKFPRRTDSLR